VNPGATGFPFWSTTVKTGTTPAPQAEVIQARKHI
jgi:hypothetical protein